MAIKNILVDALGAYISQRIISGAIPGLSGTEPGRFPKWLIPLVVPKSAVEREIEKTDLIFDSPFKLTGLGFAVSFGGFLLYAAREMERAQLSGGDGVEIDQGIGKEMSEFWEPEQPELFKAKRTLSLEMEDIAKSDDPIFACMERRGYTQKQMDRLTDNIAKKTTIDMFQKEPEDLTSSETKFQNDIQGCIDAVIETFGSLEAAGYEDCDCDN